MSAMNASASCQRLRPSNFSAKVWRLGDGSLVGGSANHDCDTLTCFMAGRGGSVTGKAIGPADPDSRLDLFLANSLTSLGAAHYRLTNFGGRVDQLAGSA